jgi:hypothetical protein
VRESGDITTFNTGPTSSVGRGGGKGIVSTSWRAVIRELDGSRLSLAPWCLYARKSCASNR